MIACSTQAQILVLRVKERPQRDAFVVANNLRCGAAVKIGYRCGVIALDKAWDIGVGFDVEETAYASIRWCAVDFPKC